MSLRSVPPDSGRLLGCACDGFEPMRSSLKTWKSVVVTNRAEVVLGQVRMGSDPGASFQRRPCWNDAPEGLTKLPRSNAPTCSRTMPLGSDPNLLTPTSQPNSALHPSLGPIARDENPPRHAMPAIDHRSNRLVPLRLLHSVPTPICSVHLRRVARVSDRMVGTIGAHRQQEVR